MSQSNQAPSGKTHPPGEPPRLIGAAIALALAILITAIAQYFAPSFDHQNANLIGLGALSIATLYVLFCLHRLMRWSGHPWGVPAAMLVAAVSFGAAFQFDGFSGEMLPQFRWRFASETVHELKSVTPQTVETTEDSATAETTAPDATGTDESTDAADSLVSSPQFLGPNRNGVYPQRSFAKPTSADQVHVVWDHGIGDGWSSFAVAGDHAITLEQRDDQECLTCYRLSDGELIWMQQHQGLHQNPLGGVGPRSTPTIDGDRVYATTATGFLWCVDQATGAVHWSRDLLELAGWDQVAFEVAAPWGYACSPLLVDGLCVLPLGGPVGEKPVRSLVALDAQSGDLVWTAGDDQLSYASPVLVTLDGQRQIVSVNEKTASGHRIEDGVVLWTFQWPGSTNTGATCSSAVPVGADRLLVGKGYGGGSALVRVAKQGDNWAATDVWRSNRVLKTKFNHTCVDGDVGYGISNGSLQAVNLNDATSYWTQPRRWRAGQGQVVLVEDVLVVQDEAGEVVFVDASIEDYHELLRIPALDSKTWNIPTVAGRYVLVRNDRQAICFQLTAK
ncbi:Outer membrane protein assembly factor BamB [Stieleria maiorica]|uniref:Outer membrane protein assembly factor BamB n=1 Tax=Stieleria maiorica TaxID=2795974 RepID=A0A5B9MBE3_9BACT|nr:PQQ-binding-like beta-propeller repeat protein [Stieleria maiorica]QEF98053.1 Outer membrane protein assembly factor BamB [Stieleria maiorica]